MATRALRPYLMAQTELLHDGLITVGIVRLEVIQQAAALADQHEKAAARAVVFLVGFEVFRQVTNALTQQSDLNFGAAGVVGMGGVLVNEGLLLLSG